MADSTSGSYNEGDVAWVLASTCLVWIMIPGIGYIYSGMSPRGNALSALMLGFLAIPVVSIQWLLYGYSITFSSTGGSFIGNFKDALFLEDISEIIVHNSTSPTGNVNYVAIPKLAHAVFQLMFAAITPAMVFGSVSGRIRTIPALVFIFVWSTVVYDFIAYWCWSNNGWLGAWGVLDFAGGTPVHISSGAAALAYCIVVNTDPEVRRNLPNDTTDVILGTLFLWFGWFGFNGGSALGANLRAIMACIVTNISASAGGLTWMFLDYYLSVDLVDGPKLSAASFCSGALAGLVAITPGSGYVKPYAALIFGVLAGLICGMASRLDSHRSFRSLYFDNFQVFAVHGVGGFVGNILTGIFADKNIALLNGQVIDGGVINGNGIQLFKQLVSSLVGLSWLQSRAHVNNRNLASL
ncbi:14289_t:CDS:2 [Acaulospora colombiana]|uniref:14289_t:CDS:1 n=1 Tax=Acaulospora colombiana TaxID=27376 RepID=A0ACA9M8Z2_9GLOM|nr:14289_t:CDS:2 [Acaulospora colombiana]